jgi:hypothetical protein
VRTIIIALALGATFVMVIGCSDGRTATQSPPSLNGLSFDERGSTPCTNEETAQAAMRTATPTTTERFSSDTETQCRLHRVLLDKSDLPDGWAMEPQGLDSVGAGEEGHCLVPFPPILASVSTRFLDSAQHEGFELILVTEEHAAADLIDALRHSCALLASSTSSYGYVPIDAPAIGDDSVVYNEVEPKDRNEISTVSSLVYARKGGVVFLLYVSGGSAVADTTLLASRAVDKARLIDSLPAPGSIAHEECAALATATPTPRKGEDALKVGLLELADMPEGWIAYRGEVCANLSDNGGGVCDPSVFPNLPEARRRAVSAFAGNKRRFVRNIIGVHSGRDATSEFEFLRKRLGTAFECSSTSHAGQFVTRKFSPLVVAAIASDQIAWRVDRVGAASTVSTEYVVLFRYHNSLATLEYSPDPRSALDGSEEYEQSVIADFEEFGRLAYEKLTQLPDDLAQ